MRVESGVLVFSAPSGQHLSCPELAHLSGGAVSLELFELLSVNGVMSKGKFIRTLAGVTK